MNYETTSIALYQWRNNAIRWSTIYERTLEYRCHRIMNSKCSYLKISIRRRRYCLSAALSNAVP